MILTQSALQNPAHISATFDVQASADRVFAVLHDVERWPNGP